MRATIRGTNHTIRTIRTNPMPPIRMSGTSVWDRDIRKRIRQIYAAAIRGVGWWILTSSAR